jgi:two-component system sensor histidine kinase/response regulator
MRVVEEPDVNARFPVRLWITLGLTLVTFGWVASNAWSSYRDADLYRSRDSRVQELRGTILHLDEVLTMSTRMAAATGDSRWEERYRKYEPQLDAAIKDTMALASDDFAIAASRQTDVANAKLVAMENEAFALVRGGRGEDARALLFAPAYDEQKALYADGMQALLTDVRTRFDNNLHQTNQRAMLSIVGSAALFGLSMAAWVAVMASLRRTQSELTRKVDERTTALTKTNQTLLAEIAERRGIQAELVGARDTALEATRAKTEFLANMSHEIRTPMNGVVGMADLLGGTALDEEQREYVEMIRTSSEHLLTVINDILDFSKIESRKLELESIPFSVRELVGTMLKPLAVKADQKGLELLLDIEPGVPAGVAGDPVRLQQVLTNLVGNAIKFTEHGHVMLEVREDTRSEGSTRLHFQVTDTGIGIPAEKRSTIFDAFSQADGSTTRRFGGTGLGLTISSNLVQLMGGRIWVESELGKGSAFHFTAGFEMAALVTAEPPCEPLLANLPVLIVDDNPVNRRILQTQLTRWHTRPTAVGSGREALDALSAAATTGRPFTLVLLDVNMPEFDGFQVAEQIAARPELAGATIMLLSSSGHHGETSRCRELGVSAYLTKPIQASDLHDSICRALNRTSTAPEGHATRPSTGQMVRALKILLTEDNLVNQRVAVGLLTKRGHDITVANNGLEALAALERSPFDVVLMDVQMPEMGGLEATAAIRQREREHGGHIRIVAMTAHAMKGDRERCLAAGMDGYLSKPIDPALLYSALEHQTSAPTRAPAAPAAAAPVDRERLMVRLEGDEQLFLDVVRLFLDDCPMRLAAIKAAVDSRDAEKIRTTAHALKGAAANLSAQRLFEAARTLERLGAERRLEPAEAAWRQLSLEATSVINMLRQFEGPPGTEDLACAS